MESNTSLIWYGYTGRSVIGVAGRAIAHILSKPVQLDAWQGRAAGYYDELPAYHPLRHVPRATFIAAMVAPLAIRDSGKQQAQAFTSLAEPVLEGDGITTHRLSLSIRSCYLHRGCDVTSGHREAKQVIRGALRQCRYFKEKQCAYRNDQ